MAYAITTLAGPHGLSDRLAGFFAAVRTSLAQRRVYRQTLRELRSLNSRELADLGIHRSMITRIAMEAAYGN